MAGGCNADGATRQGRIGVGWSTLRDVRPMPADDPSLSVLDVDRAIAEQVTHAPNPFASSGGTG